MTVQESRHDAHHDLTWLAGALARAVFLRLNASSRVRRALEHLAACDLSLHDEMPSPALAPACRWLPEALTAALRGAEEAAMALAAAHEHLAWRAVPDVAPARAAATAQVAGAKGPLLCRRGRLRLLLTAPQARMPLRDDDAPANTSQLLFVLAGEAAWRDEHGALRHVLPADGAIMPAGTHIMSVSPTPLLAAVLRA